MILKRIAQVSLLSACITLLNSGISSAGTPLSEHFKYIADAANQIHFLWTTSQDPKDHAKEIAEQACRALGLLAEDGQFKEMIFKVTPTIDVDLKNSLSSLAEINSFIDKEELALNDIGVDHLTSIEALAAAIPFAKTFDTKKLNPDAILKDISDLRNKACSLVGEVEHKEHLQYLIGQIAFGIAVP